MKLAHSRSAFTESKLGGVVGLLISLLSIGLPLWIFFAQIRVIRYGFVQYDSGDVDGVGGLLMIIPVLTPLLIIVAYASLNREEWPEKKFNSVVGIGVAITISHLIFIFSTGAAIWTGQTKYMLLSFVIALLPLVITLWFVGVGIMHFSRRAVYSVFSKPKKDSVFSKLKKGLVYGLATLLTLTGTLVVFIWVGTLSVAGAQTLFTDLNEVFYFGTPLICLAFYTPIFLSRLKNR